MTAYDILLSSLRPCKRARMVREGESDRVEGEEVCVESVEEEETEDRGTEKEGDSVGNIGRGPGEIAMLYLTRYAHVVTHSPDPFSVHCETVLSDEEVETLQLSWTQPLHYQHTPVSNSLIYYPHVMGIYATLGSSTGQCDSGCMLVQSTQLHPNLYYQFA